MKYWTSNDTSNTTVLKSKITRAFPNRCYVFSDSLVQRKWCTLPRNWECVLHWGAATTLENLKRTAAAPVDENLIANKPIEVEIMVDWCPFLNRIVFYLLVKSWKRNYRQNVVAIENHEWHSSSFVEEHNQQKIKIGSLVFRPRLCVIAIIIIFLCKKSVTQQHRLTKEVSDCLLAIIMRAKFFFTPSKKDFRR